MLIVYLLIDFCHHNLQELGSRAMKCQFRGVLVGIIAPQECNQTYNCVETAMGREGGREGKRWQGGTEY